AALGTTLDNDPVQRRTVASLRDYRAQRLASADHLQLAPFRFGLSRRIFERVADRSAGAAPLGRFLHGRADRRFERSRLSDREGQLPPFLYRCEPGALRTRSTNVFRA